MFKKLKINNLFLVLLFCILLAVAIVCIPSSTIANANTEVEYIDENGDVRSITEYDFINSCNSQLNLGTGWYVVNADTTINYAVIVNGDVKLVLKDGFTFTINGNNNQALSVRNGMSLTIYGQTLGTGKLIANAPDGSAGIGASLIYDGLGTITINGGTIEATGGYGGAGIGGVYHNQDIDRCNGKNITINGGTVTAQGGEYAAGIGGGSNPLEAPQLGGSGENIVINGGTVTATGGFQGAGIGGGCYGSCKNIAINGGTVTATGGTQGAGIGGGLNGSCEDVEINGGTVTAKGGDYAAGIGGGCLGSCKDIAINDGTVTATGGSQGAGIGGGDSCSCEDVEINGGTVTAKGGYFAAGIGGGNQGQGTNIIINNAFINSTGGQTAAGIGGGFSDSSNNISITNCIGTISGGSQGAGIGGGMNGFATDIRVSDSDLIISTTNADAIGNGYYAIASSSKIYIDVDVTIKNTNTSEVIVQNRLYLDDISSSLYGISNLSIKREFEYYKSATKYILENASILQSSNSDYNLEEGWYVIKKDTTINGTIYYNGEINILLCDGVKLSIISDDSAFCKQGDGSFKINVYGQREQTGQMEVTTTSTTKAAIETEVFNLFGGSVKINAVTCALSCDDFYVDTGRFEALADKAIEYSNTKNLPSNAIILAGASKNDANSVSDFSPSDEYSYIFVESQEETKDILFSLPSDYTEDQDGNITINGDLKIKEGLGLKVVDSVKITDKGIKCAIALRASTGFKMSSNPQILNEQDKFEIFILEDQDTADDIASKYGLSNVKADDIIILYYLAYTIIYTSDYSLTDAYYFNYYPNEIVSIKCNDFGFEKPDYYFAGWDYKGEALFPEKEFEIAKFEMILFPNWINEELTHEIIDDYGNELYGSYYLSGDIELDSLDKFYILEDGKFSLDLNGHVLDLGKNSMNFIINPGELYITSSNNNIPHYFEYNRESNWVYLKEPTTKQKNTAIVLNKITSSTKDGTIIKIYGGVITNGCNGAVQTNNLLVCENVNFIGNYTTSSWGGAVGYHDGKMAFYSTNFFGNSSESNGGALAIVERYSVLLNDCKVMYNTAHNGGGLFSSYDGRFVLDGNTIIRYNYAETEGQNYYTTGGGYFEVKNSFTGLVEFFAEDYWVSFIAAAEDEKNVENFILTNNYDDRLHIIKSNYNEDYQCYEYEIIDYLKVVFVVDDSDIAPETQYLLWGEKAVEPVFETSKKGFIFKCWSLTQYRDWGIDFDENIYSDKTYYAKYELDYIQPTADNPCVSFLEDPEDCVITYQWWIYIDDDNYYMLEGETSNELKNNYKAGKFYCVVYLDGEYESETDIIDLGYLNISINDETSGITVDLDDESDITYQWYKEYPGNIISREITTNEVVDINYMKYDNINKVWTITSEVQDEAAPCFKYYGYKGERVEVTINAPLADDINLNVYDYDYDEGEDLYSEGEKNYKFVFNIEHKAWFVFTIYAYIGDWDEYVDCTVTITIYSYEWPEEKLEGETNNTLSNIEDKVGWHYCIVSIDGIEYCKPYIELEDKIIEEPNANNNYSYEVIAENGVNSYQWYEYDETVDDVTDDLDCVRTDWNDTEYDSATKTWSVEEANAGSRLKIFGLELNAGDVIIFNVKTLEPCNIVIGYWDTTIFYVGNTQEITYEYTMPFDGSPYFVANVFTQSGGLKYHGFSVKATLIRKTYTEVEGQTEKILTASEDGKYVCRAITYKNVLESAPVNYCVHEYGDVTYTWNEDNTLVSAKKTCSKCQYVFEEEVTVIKEITQIATEDQEELTTLTATFKTSGFVAQTKVIKTGDKLQKQEDEKQEDEKEVIIEPNEKGSMNSNNEQTLTSGAIAGIAIGTTSSAIIIVYFVLGFVLYRNGKLAGKFFSKIYKWIKKK